MARNVRHETKSEKARGPTLEEAVPRGVFDAVEAFLLIDEWEEASNRVDALEWLFKEALDLYRDKAIARWVEKNRGKDFILGATADGTLLHRRNVVPRRIEGVVPKQLVDYLIRSILSRPEEIRDLREGAITSLIGEWEQLILDDEKLVGHLFRVHRIESRYLTGELNPLVSRHSQIHTKARRTRRERRGPLRGTR